MNSDSYSISNRILKNCCEPLRSLNSMIRSKKEIRSWMFFSVISYIMLSSMVLFSIMYYGQTAIIAREDRVPIHSYGSSLIAFQDKYYVDTLNLHEPISKSSKDVLDRSRTYVPLRFLALLQVVQELFVLLSGQRPGSIHLTPSHFLMMLTLNRRHSTLLYPSPKHSGTCFCMTIYRNSV
jgi:hypothetical protein